MEERIKELESKVSELTLYVENLQGQLNLKADKDKLHDLLGDKELSNLEIGKLTDDEMKRFKLGPYSKNNTPGSRSS